MDEVTRAYYEVVFERDFLRKKGDAFQDFFATIMEKRYPADFVRVRPWGNVGDRKNDGYQASRRRLFQCYAPNELSARESIAKIEEDFAGALPYWEQYFGTWVFVHNSREGLGPDVLAKLLSLKQQHAPLDLTHWGFEELRREAMELPKEDLASLLGPAPSRQGMLELGMADLIPVLDQVAMLPAATEPDIRPVPPDKLARNMLSDAVAVLLKAGMSRVDLVRMYFRGQPGKRDQIAVTFQETYRRLRGNTSPDEVFVELQRFAGGAQVPSSARQSAVLAVLAFFFEECDIFERPESGASQ